MQGGEYDLSNYYSLKRGSVRLLCYFFATETAKICAVQRVVY